MTKNEIMAKVEDIFHRVLGNESIVLTDETTAEDIKEWTSLSHAELVIAMEKELNIKFSLREMMTSCALACVLFNNICRCLSEIAEKLGAWQFPVLQYVGRSAMNFYVPHYLFFAIVYNIVGCYSDTWYSGWQGLVIVTIAYMALLPAINWLDGYLKRAKNTQIVIQK